MNQGTESPSDRPLVSRETSLEPELRSAGRARRLLHEALDEADRLQWADSGELAISEVVTNALLHAHTRIDVRISVHADHLRVEVRDGNPAVPQQRGYDEHATTGRGMALITALTDDCGVQRLPTGGKAVWFQLSGGTSEPTKADVLAVWDLADPGSEVSAPVLTPVVLQAMPATLWMAARQHHDALLRELVLYLAEHDDVTVDLTLADAARGLVSGALQEAVDQAQQQGTARPVVPAGHPAPLPAVPHDLTLTMRIPSTLAPAYTALQEALDTAERLASAGRLLARGGLPEIVAVRDWVCDQVIAQLAGVPASPWPGTAQQRFETTVNEPSDQLTWNDDLVRDCDRGVVAADDANRIVAVSRPLADLLGWQVDDLVGRRVVTLIPPHLREAHVAGFSRHLTTGESHVLGVPLLLPVLHADGREVLCSFLIERAPQGEGRAVYLAWIAPAP
jgi:PAS domain S-box-containing protein